MSKAERQRVHQIFQAALERADSERAAFVEEACAGDAELLAQVASLLEADAGEHRLLDEPGVEGQLERIFSLVGRQVGPYRVLERIGEGGMGTVYLGERADGQFEQQVALKLLRPGMDSEGILRRFAGERRILARLEHPNIARLVDGGATDEGQPWFAMEYVDGEPLDDWCDHRRLPVEERLELFLTVCDALRYAHTRLIIHRDLKPDNILVAQDDTGRPRVKLLDFGIAKLLEDDRAGITRTGNAPLTPAYAAPEQMEGRAVSTATDVYALGVILYELLTGVRPYQVEGSNPVEMAEAIRTARPERPSTVVGRTDDADALRDRRTRSHRLRRRLAGDLDVICLKALRKEPERRYASVEALQDDIRRHLDGLPVTARPDTVAYRARKFVARNRGTVLTGTAFVLSVLFFGISSVLQAVQLERERDAARLERDRAEAVSDFLVEVFQASDPVEALGAEVTARQLLDRGSRRIMEDGAMDPDLRSTLMSVMGDVYVNYRLLPDAVPLYEAALEQAETRWDPPHPELARALARLGGVYAGNGDFDRGLPMLEASIGQLEELGGEADPVQLARTLNQTGVLMREAGRFDEAESYYRRALSLARSDSTVNADVGASLLNNLGQIEEAMGRYPEAAAYHREALTTRESRLDSLHPQVLTSLNNLAGALGRQGDFPEAARLHMELVRRSERVYGDAPIVGVYLNNTASIYKRWGRPREAEPLQRRALAIFREQLGEEHPRTAMGYNNLANILHDQGQAREAVELHRQALALNRRIYGDEHDRTAGSLTNLAAALRDLGELGEAVSLYRETLAIDRRVLGDAHPFVAQDHVNLADILSERDRPGDYERARAHIDTAAVLQEANLPPRSPAHPKRLSSSARIYLRAERFEAAEADARRAVALNDTLFPDGSAPEAWSRAILGAALAGQGRLDEAGELLRPAYRRLEADLGPEARDTRLVAAWLERWGLAGNTSAATVNDRGG